MAVNQGRIDGSGSKVAERPLPDTVPVVKASIPVATSDLPCRWIGTTRSGGSRIPSPNAPNEARLRIRRSVRQRDADTDFGLVANS